MGKYDDLAGQAAKETDAELEAEINEMKNVDMAKLFPNTADQAVVNELIAEVNKSTSRNEQVTAMKAIAVKLSKEGAEALKTGLKIGKKVMTGL